MKLDYSPLEESTPTPIQSSKTDIPKFNNTAGAIILTIFIIATTGVLILPIVFAPWIYIALKKYINKSGYSAIRLSNFAIKNGFSYQWGGGDVDKVGRNKPKPGIRIAGIFGSQNKDVLASNIISGVYDGMRFEMFNLLGKGFYTFMRVKLQNNYPHIVLDSRANNPIISNIGHYFSEDSRIHLEGDFDNFFKAYSSAPAVDMLRILSPDMMSLMIDSGHKYDIEIVEDNLHIICNYKLSDKEGVKYFFQIVDALMAKLDRRTATRNAEFDSLSRVK